MRWLALLLLAGCATVETTAMKNIHEVDEKPANCSMVAKVYGSSGIGGIAASTGVQNAKNEALAQAVAAGATHILWVEISSGFSHQHVIGNAYRC